MPEITGFELIKEIKRNKSHYVIYRYCFFSDARDDNSEFGALVVDRVVFKPIPPEILLSHVVELLTETNSFFKSRVSNYQPYPFRNHLNLNMIGGLLTNQRIPDTINRVYSYFCSSSMKKNLFVF